MKALITILILFATVSEAHATGAARSHRRMANGVKAGEVTQGEARRAALGQARLANARRQAHADGDVSPAERSKIRHINQNQNQRIFRVKHNENKPK